MNDRCACIGVDQANGRVAGSKSKAGNFLSGGECVCRGGCGGWGWAGGFAAFEWVTNCRCCMLVRVVTAPSHLTVSVCAQVGVRECVTGGESQKVQEKDGG